MYTYKCLDIHRVETRGILGNRGAINRGRRSVEIVGFFRGKLIRVTDAARFVGYFLLFF